MHAWDELTPVEEVMRGLDDVVRQGKVLYVGVSNLPARLISRANILAVWRLWTPFVSLRIENSLIERTPESGADSDGRSLALTVTAWSPLASGMLTGEYSKKGAGRASKERRLDKTSFTPMNDRNFRIAEEVKKEGWRGDGSVASAGCARLAARAAQRYSGPWRPGSSLNSPTTLAACNGLYPKSTRDGSTP